MGHSKSLNSTSTTGAPGVPKLGCRSVFSLSSSRLERVLRDIVEVALARSSARPWRRSTGKSALALPAEACTPTSDKSWHIRRLGVGDLHFDLRSPDLEVPHVGFKGGLVERGLFLRGLSAALSGGAANRPAASKVKHSSNRDINRYCNGRAGRRGADHRGLWSALAAAAYGCAGIGSTPVVTAPGRAMPNPGMTCILLRVALRTFCVGPHASTSGAARILPREMT